MKAIPRVLEIYKEDSPVLQSVISIAPPAKANPKKTGDSPLYWVTKYFTSTLTDGFKVYIEAKNLYPNATFARAKPLSEKAGKFAMDETNVKAMEKSIEKERLEEPHYYDNIIDMAALTVTRLEDIQLSQTFLEMMFYITNDAVIKRNNYEIGIKISENILKKIPTSAIEGNVFRHIFK